jgi:hypothetical protein
MNKDVVGMVWAEEPGMNIFVFEGDNNRRVISIHGLVDGHDRVLAVATVANHNRDELAEAIGTGCQRFSVSEVTRLMTAAQSGKK